MLVLLYQQDMKWAVCEPRKDYQESKEQFYKTC